MTDTKVAQKLHTQVSIEGEPYSYTVHTDISSIADEWDPMMPPESFTQKQYLLTLEQTNPSHLKNLYILLRDGSGTVVGTLLLQSIILSLSESFDYENYSTNKSLFARIWFKIQKIAISLFKFRMLTIGNLYLTGQYGMYFPDTPADRRFELAEKIVKQLKKQFRCTPYKFSGVLYKDFFSENETSQFEKLQLERFEIDPNMILPMRDNWNSFDDYLLDMKSKYRVRLKKALKCFKGIEKRELTEAEVVHWNSRMYELYEKILDGSGFVLAKGDENYFKLLKKNLQDNYHVVGFFLDGEMVGFYTWLMEDGKMDSHFIGLEPQLNNKYQLYLNILLGLVGDAIDEGAKSIYYFRTALEIKSSVGAEPFPMACYFRHTNRIINRLVPLAFKYFVPQQNWIQRHPFKE